MHPHRRWLASLCLLALALMGCERLPTSPSETDAPSSPAFGPPSVELIGGEVRGRTLILHSAGEGDLEWEILPGGVLRQETQDYLVLVNPSHHVQYEARKDPLTGGILSSVEVVDHRPDSGLRQTVTFIDHQSLEVERRTFEALPGAVREEFVADLRAWYEPLSLRLDVGIFGQGLLKQQAFLQHEGVPELLEAILLEALRRMDDPEAAALVSRLGNGLPRAMAETEEGDVLNDLRQGICMVFAVSSLICTAGGLVNPVCTVAVVGSAGCLLYEILSQGPDLLDRLGAWLEEELGRIWDDLIDGLVMPW